MYHNHKHTNTLQDCLKFKVHTVFTWLNATATIIHALNFNVATIQGQPLIEGGIYCTEAPNVRLLFDQVEDKRGQPCMLMYLTSCFRIYSKLNNGCMLTNILMECICRGGICV